MHNQQQLIKLFERLTSFFKLCRGLILDNYINSFELNEQYHYSLFCWLWCTDQWYWEIFTPCEYLNHLVYKIAIVACRYFNVVVFHPLENKLEIMFSDDFHFSDLYKLAHKHQISETPMSIVVFTETVLPEVRVKFQNIHERLQKYYRSFCCFNAPRYPYSFYEYNFYKINSYRDAYPYFQRGTNVVLSFKIDIEKKAAYQKYFAQMKKNLLWYRIRGLFLVASKVKNGQFFHILTKCIICFF